MERDRQRRGAAPLPRRVAEDLAEIEQTPSTPRRGRPRNSPARDERTRREREDWAARVRQLREALGDVTQAELARRLGVRPLAVSRWERAVVSPGPALRMEIVRILEEAGGAQS